MRFILPAFLVLILVSCSQKIYLVRHAEKAAAGPNMSSDVPLTEAGQERATALKEKLKNKKIGVIYSTNTIRTKSTAQPTAEYFSLPINVYNPRPDTNFYKVVRTSGKNTLIVGHSNTVDDIVKLFCGNTTDLTDDLPETAYDNLFIIKKMGNHYVLKKKKYGKPSQ